MRLKETLLAVHYRTKFNLNKQLYDLFQFNKIRRRETLKRVIRGWWWWGGGDTLDLQHL